jgi:hypothetical protein
MEDEDIIFDDIDNMLNDDIEESEYTNETIEITEALLKHFKLQSSNNKKAVIKCKTTEILNHQSKQLFSDNDYKNEIYNNFSYKGLTDFEPEIVLLPGRRKDNYKELNDLWNYFRIHQSSSTGNNKNGGIKMRLLVRDRATKKYVGVLSIDSDHKKNTPRDKDIGWSKEQLRKNLYNVVNIRTCIGLQGFAKNTNLGKLLMMLTFSREVNQLFCNRYGFNYLSVLTTSLKGKSCQYSDVDGLNFIGYTKGINVGDIPNELYEKCRAYYKKYVSNKSYNKLFLMDKLTKYLGINNEFTQEKMKRGVYINHMINNYKEYYNGIDNTYTLDLKSINDITKEWKQKYAIKQYLKQEKNNNLIKTVEINKMLKNIEHNKYVKEYMCNIKNALTQKRFNEINRTKVENFKINNTVIPINNLFRKYILDPSYLAGFIDGDGSIYITEKLSLQIAIAQCNIDILLLINKHFKYTGNIYLSSDIENIDISNELLEKIKHIENDNNNNKNDKLINFKPIRRKCYVLRFTGATCKEVLEFIKNTLVIKHKQSKLGLEYTSLIRTQNTTKKNEYMKKISELNKTHYIPILKDRINHTYICGLIDAEGCIRVDTKNNKVMTNGSLKISQMKHPTVLHEIKEYFGLGSIHKDLNKDNEYIDSYLLITYNKIKKFLNDNIRYFVVKRLQIDLFKELYKLKSITNSPEVNEYKIKYYREIHLDKHKTSTVTGKMLSKYNSVNQEKTKGLKSVIYKDTKIINVYVKCNKCGTFLVKDSLNRHKRSNCSLNKSHNNNDTNNIGDKIATTHLFKGVNVKVSDINIEKIRIELEKEDNITKIGNKFNVGTGTVNNIKKGIIVPTYDRISGFVKKYKYIQEKHKEETTEKLKLFGEDKEQLIKFTNTINKRQFDFDTAIDIINMKKIGKHTQNDIYEMKLKRKNGNIISKEQIKNLWSGRNKLFKCEFTSDTKISYDEYLETIKSTPKGSKGKNRKISDEQIKIGYRLIKNQPSITIKEIAEVLQIDTSTAAKIKHKEFVYNDMPDDEYNKCIEDKKEKQNNYDKLFSELDKKYDSIIKNNKEIKKEYSEWKKSYKNRISNGITTKKYIEILKLKPKMNSGEITEYINDKYDLSLKKLYVSNLCSKNKKMFRTYDFDILIYPEQKITLETAIKYKNTSAKSSGRKANYTKEQEEEIVNKFMYNMGISIVSIANEYSIDRNAVSKFKEKARNILEN